MKHFLVARVLFFTTMVAYAGMDSRTIGSAGWEKLSEQQKADILQQVTVQASKSDSPLSTAQKVGEWVDIGTKMGQMMGGAAKELGIAVNDFVRTPVGQMTMTIIAIKFVGPIVVHVIGSVIILTVGLSFIMYMIRRSTTVRYEYDSDKKDLFGRSKLKKVTRDELPDGNQAAYIACAGIVFAASIILAVTF